MNNLLNTAMIDYAQSNPDKLTRIKNYKTVKDANGNVKELSYELADGTETQGVDPLQINTYAPDDPRNQEGILALNALKQKIFSVSTTPPTPGQTYAGQTLTRDMFIGTHVYINDHYDDVEEKLLDSPIQKIAIWNGTGFTISN